MTQRPSNPATSAIDRVYLIFKTHLDLGFTDFASEVERLYFKKFIPNAISLAKQLRLKGSEHRFIWTTGSWLIYEYLERASVKARREAEEAIAAGDIVWHALPFTFHSELADAETFRYGLSLSRRLDERFGRETIAAKMTDVPGHTRAIVPLLAEAGVRFLHIGRNRASCPPDVPENFVWRHDDGSEIVVVYHHDYGYSSFVPGMRSAIAFAHGRDNHPPQDARAIKTGYHRLQKEYPHAEVVGATLDDYGHEIWEERNRLPVVTRELGDTWIHGIASHPERVAAYKAMTRIRRRWISDGRFDPAQNPEHDKFSRLIMCVPEHTWGIMVDQLEDEFLNSFAERLRTHKMLFRAEPGIATGYDQDSFERLRSTSRWRRVEASWDEQLDYVRRAVAVLPDDQRREARAALDELRPARPDLSKWTEVAAGKPIEGERFTARISAETGAIDHLEDRRTRKVWVDRTHQLGRFLFENFDRDDFDRFARQYLRNPKRTEWWSLLAFTKLGMDPNREIVHQEWSPILDTIVTRFGTNSTDVLTQMHLPREAVERFGAPREIYLKTSLSNDEPIIHLELLWFDKAPRRLPAACWLSVNPLVDRSGEWMLQKMGALISPLEVIRRGNRRMHAVESVVYPGPGPSCTITPLDSPLCAPGRPSLTNFHQRQPALSQGFHFNLWNNVWNTNFPYWHGGDCRFRFEVTF